MGFRHNNNYNNIHTYYVHWNINNQHVARARERERERQVLYLYWKYTYHYLVIVYLLTCQYNLIGFVVCQHMLSHELNYIVFCAASVHKMLIKIISMHFTKFNCKLSLKMHPSSAHCEVILAKSASTT